MERRSTTEEVLKTDGEKLTVPSVSSVREDVGDTKVSTLEEKTWVDGNGGSEALTSGTREIRNS